MIEEIQLEQFFAMVGTECAVSMLEAAKKEMDKAEGPYNSTLQFFTLTASNGDKMYIVLDVDKNLKTGETFLSTIYASDEQMPDELLDIINDRKKKTSEICPGKMAEIKLNNTSVYKSSTR